MSRLPVRDSGDDVLGNWIEYDVEVDKPISEDHRKRTCTNTLLTNLKVTCDNVARIPAAGRTHWKIRNETFHCLKNRGYHLEHNFGYSRAGAVCSKRCVRNAPLGCSCLKLKRWCLVAVARSRARISHPVIPVP